MQNRILPEYYSPRKTRIKEQQEARDLQKNFEFLLKMARDQRKQERVEARGHKAAERSRNKSEVERLTKSTSVYMKEVLVDPFTK